MSAACTPAAASHRISAVVAETGLAKELVHHYLRLGLLPRSPSRARYTDQQVRLLRQIRRLREDHNLPLEVIRQLFAAFDFDPTPIEALALSESVCRRMTKFAARGHFLAPDTLSVEALLRETGVEAERLDAYVAAGLIEPLRGPGDATPRTFSEYDRNVVALCEHGLELGVPFDTFRTVASYVRVGFALERTQLFDVGAGAPEQIGAGLFVRSEIFGSLVQNVLSSAMHAHLHRAFSEVELDPGEPSLDDLLYRPSPAFVSRHDLGGAIDRARAALGPDEPDPWWAAGRLLLHAGRYREAVFVLEQGIGRWPEHPGLRAVHGRGLLAIGAGVATPGPSDDPTLQALWVLAALKQARRAGPAGLMHRAADLLRHLEAALEGAREAPRVVRLETELLCGWLLTALPETHGDADRGRALLVATLDALDEGPPDPLPLPGLADRLRINAAYLLFKALGRGRAANAPSREALCATICRLDPASSFAGAAYASLRP